jgi:hypothetical protein
MDIDELRSIVQCPEEDFTDPPQHRLSSDPQAELNRLQGLAIDFLKQFPTGSDDGGSPRWTASEENCDPDIRDKCTDADPGW